MSAVFPHMARIAISPHLSELKHDAEQIVESRMAPDRCQHLDPWRTDQETALFRGAKGDEASVIEPHATFAEVGDEGGRVGVVHGVEAGAAGGIDVGGDVVAVEDVGRRHAG